MKKGAKRALKIVLSILAVIVVVVIVAWIWIDTLVATGIEKGGTAVLGVETTVDAVSVSILGSSFGMDRLTVGNPEGYTTAHLMQTGEFRTELQRDTVFTDEVVISLISLDGLDVNIEQAGMGNNVSVVMENVKKYAKPKEEEEEEGKAVRIEKVMIRNVVVHVTLPGGMEAASQTIELPEIVLSDVSSEGSKSEIVGQVTAQVITKILQEVAAKAGNLPADLKAAIETDAAAAMEDIKAQASEQAEQAVEGAAEKAGEAVEGLFKGLGGEKDAQSDEAADGQ